MSQQTLKTNNSEYDVHDLDYMPSNQPKNAQSKDEPFGRQPKPVYVTITGDPADVNYWLSQLMRHAEFKGDLTQSSPHQFGAFTIYPRAVND